VGGDVVVVVVFVVVVVVVVVFVVFVNRDVFVVLSLYISQPGQSLNSKQYIGKHVHTRRRSQRKRSKTIPGITD
jgi:hypothetical protein